MVEAETKRQVKDLEAKLARVQQEKEELQRDVEALCMQSNDALTFRSSSVLQERVIFTEKELSQCRAALAGTQAELESVREDLREVKDAKRRSDAAFQTQHDRAGALERELAFYQTQAAKVMADRDRAVFEGEELRSANLALEACQRVAEGRARTEASQRAHLERELADARRQASALQVQAKQAEALPALRSELRACGEEIAKRTAEVEELEARLQATEQALAAERDLHKATAAAAEGSRDAAAAAAAAAAETERALRGEVVQLRDETRRLQQLLSAAERRAEESSVGEVEASREAAELRQALARREAALKVEHEAAVARLVEHQGEEVASLRARLTTATREKADLLQQLEDVAQQKVGALVRLSTEEQEHARADRRIEALTKELASVREQLEQATQEKVTALMRMADLQQQQQDPTHQAGAPSSGVVPGQSHSQQQHKPAVQSKVVAGSPSPVRNDSANDGASPPVKPAAAAKDMQSVPGSPPRRSLGGWFTSPPRT